MKTYAQKRVLILLTGGTIAGNVAKSDVTDNVKSNPDSFISIINNCKEILKSNWNIDVLPEMVEVVNIDSSNILPEHWSSFAKKIEESYDDYDAFIILHGTNTMGYTATALSFAFENINKPVVLTGAQVPLGYLGSDATTNLVNSIRIAVWGYHQMKGIFAVFGSKIISGVRVKKGTDFDYDPFRSFQAGAVGRIGRFIQIDEAALTKHVAYLSKIKPPALQSRALSVKRKFDLKHIASLTEFPGMVPDLFKTLVEHNGIKAFVFRAFGAGDASSHLFDALEYLKAKEIPIVITSQAPSGVASFKVNETGQYIGENDLAIPAFDMSIEAMTTKMSWLLAQKMNYHQIKQKMGEDLRGEISVEQEFL